MKSENPLIILARLIIFLLNLLLYHTRMLIHRLKKWWIENPSLLTCVKIIHNSAYSIVLDCFYTPDFSIHHFWNHWITTCQSNFDKQSSDLGSFLVRYIITTLPGWVWHHKTQDPSGYELLTPGYFVGLPHPFPWAGVWPRPPHASPGARPGQCCLRE